MKSHPTTLRRFLKIAIQWEYGLVSDWIEEEKCYKLKVRENCISIHEDSASVDGPENTDVYAHLTRVVEEAAEMSDDAISQETLQIERSMP